MIRAGIVGITGYTGEELLKILVKHQGVDVRALCGRSFAETRDIKDIYPDLAFTGLTCEALDISVLAKKAEVVFLALPHRVSFTIVPELIAKGVKVIDLSADFRLMSAATYEKWYGEKHTAGELLKSAAYGLPELYRKTIKSAQLIANPGCYPTTAILGCAPVVKHAAVDLGSLIIDSKSGISGAGRKSVAEFFKNEHPNFRPYNIAGAHRHIPEIEQELSRLSGKKITITFTPHLIPVERGMLSTIYIDTDGTLTTAGALELYRSFYANEPFVRILPEGKVPGIRGVVNTNYCDIGVKVDERTRRLVIIAAIDNLVKGASGQAVQNMNIMFGMKETEGLI